MPAEAEMAGERRRLGGDALHQVAVGDDREHAVVLDLAAVALAQEALGDRHADAVAEALAERAGRDLDAGRDVDAVALRVAGRERAPLAEALDLVEREVVAREVQDRVQQHRPVAGAEDEAVAVRPLRVARVVLHDPLEEQVRRGRHGHRHAGMAGVRLLHRVHRERADRVDAEPFDVLGHGGVLSRIPYGRTLPLPRRDPEGQPEQVRMGRGAAGDQARPLPVRLGRLSDGLRVHPGDARRGRRPARRDGRGHGAHVPGLRHPGEDHRAVPDARRQGRRRQGRVRPRARPELEARRAPRGPLARRSATRSRTSSRSTSSPRGSR